MQAVHLKTKELSYEIKLRGLDPPDNVDEKRKILTGLLSQENANRSFTGTLTNTFTNADDVACIKETLIDVKKIITTFAGDKSDSTYKRLSSRLNHVSGRISRNQINNEEEENVRKNLKYELLGLETDLFFKVNPTSASTPTDVASFSYKGEPVHKWNIFFTGSIQKESVHSFLEKVEVLRISRGLSKQELFMRSCDLFKDTAFTWYLNNRNKLSSWDELIMKLKADFLPCYYNQDLELEINNRTQGPNESVAIFIASMEGLFNRLTDTPDEQSRVNKIRRNLLPCFVSQLALHNPNTIDELSDLCKRIEESRT